jgi:uroporphyrinogen-III synthase
LKKSTKRILYFGLSIENFSDKNSAVHYPLIKIVPRKNIKRSLLEVEKFSHIIFTSQTTVDIFFSHISKIQHPQCISIGPHTKKALLKKGIFSECPQGYTQEGIIQYLKTCSLKNSYIFLPRSSLARKKIDRFLSENNVKFATLALYDTKFYKPNGKINFQDFEEFVFTSPSTVDSFFHFFQEIPPHIKVRHIGPITKAAYESRLEKNRVEVYDDLKTN